MLTDRTETIRASVADVQFTLVLTIALVVLVIFICSCTAQVLGRRSSRGVTLPVSLIATFGIMSRCAGFSLDNLSLMALTIASGFVVDDAIVMIENIVRFIEAGETPLRRLPSRGRSKSAFTIISLTVSLIAVFIHAAADGRGDRPAVPRVPLSRLSAAVVISAIVSLTLTPMMCSQTAGSPEAPDHQPGALFRWSERFFDRPARRAYDSRACAGYCCAIRP